MQWMQCKSLWIIYAKCINVNATGYCLRVWWRQPKRIMCNDELSTVIIACWLKRSENYGREKAKICQFVHAMPEHPKSCSCDRCQQTC